jgi:hypothetical protein
MLHLPCSQRLQQQEQLCSIAVDQRRVGGEGGVTVAVEDGVQFGQHGLEPGWRVGCRCGLGKELGDLGGVSLAYGMRDTGTQVRPGRATLPAITAVRQIALYCLLPGVSRGWRVARSVARPERSAG